MMTDACHFSIALERESPQSFAAREPRDIFAGEDSLAHSELGGRRRKNTVRIRKGGAIPNRPQVGLPLHLASVAGKYATFHGRQTVGLAQRRHQRMRRV